jgi:hypothetical protein
MTFPANAFDKEADDNECEEADVGASRASTNGMTNRVMQWFLGKRYSICAVAFPGNVSLRVMCAKHVGYAHSTVSHVVFVRDDNHHRRPVREPLRSTSSTYFLSGTSSNDLFGHPSNFFFLSLTNGVCVRKISDISLMRSPPKSWPRSDWPKYRAAAVVDSAVLSVGVSALRL